MEQTIILKSVACDVESGFLQRCLYDCTWGSRIPRSCVHFARAARRLDALKTNRAGDETIIAHKRPPLAAATKNIEQAITFLF